MIEGKSADRRDDVYSFACVIYEMLCGEHPFGKLTALEAREAGSKVPPLQELSRGQNAALSQALAFKREARTGAVEQVLAGIGSDIKPRARPIAPFGAAILAAIVAVGLTYLALDRLRVSRHSLVVEGAISKAPPPSSHDSRHGGQRPSTRSIAVLPFVNISGDQKQEYFSDGLSEELIDHLVRSTDLTVIARTSSFQFKGKNEDVRSIARRLDSDPPVEGSVRKEGQRLRITAS